MKFLSYLLYGALLFCTATGNAQNPEKRITARFTDVPLSKALTDIEKISGYTFFYNTRDIDLHRKTTLSVRNMPLGEALRKLFENTKLDFRFSKKQIVLFLRNDAKSLSLPSDGGVVTISGRVCDEAGNPLTGVTIIEQGTSNGTVSGSAGKFSIRVRRYAVLSVSFIGYKSRIVSTGKAANIEIVLTEEAEIIDDVVVVGFAVQKKQNLTGAVGVVDMDAMELRPVRNASQMLQGLVPGLNVSQSAGGALDSEPTLNIRGVTTIGSGSTGSPLVLIDGMEGSINAINPQDIESISVLKDASTSSIYGSRAAFGVILVTTKSGKIGRTSISYSNNFRLNKPINMPDMVDSYRFALYFNDAAGNVGDTPHFTEERLQNIRDFMAGKLNYSMIPLASTPDRWAAGYNHSFDNVDWYDALYRDNSFSQEHNISINGGSETFRYFVSGNLLDQNGLLKISDDNYKRYATTVKVNGRLAKWLQGNFSMRYIHEASEKPYYLNNTFYFDLARQGWPVLPLYDPNGYLFSAPSPALNLRDGGRIEKKSDWLYQQAQFILEPVRNWKTTVELNYRLRTDFNHSDQQVTYNHDVFGNPYVFQPDSHVNEVANRNSFYNLNIYSEYGVNLREAHNLKFMIGYQNELNLYKTIRSMRNGIIVSDMPVLDLTSGTDSKGEPISPTLAGSNSDWATAGFFGRVNYNYKERLLVEFNIRYDGTSRFRRANRWNWFPSASIGWNMAQEEFMRSARDVVGMLKLRGSYGVLGNQNTTGYYPTYQTMPYKTAAGAWLINGLKTNTSTAPELISSSLTWEKVRSWNIGLDFALLDNRLTGSFDYFNRYTLDMVGPAPELPVTLGTAVPKMNNTDLKTYGFEFNILWNDLIGDVRYHAGFMLSDSQTEITSYPNATGSLSASLYRTGQKVGEIWGYETIGIARSQGEMDAHLATLPNGGQNALDALGGRWEAGDVMYRDRNQDGKIDNGAGTEGDPGDMRIIGNTSPRFNFSIDLGVEWKGLGIGALFQGVMKRDYFTDSYYFWGMGSKGLWWATAFEEHMNYFRENPNHPLGQNLSSYYPRPLIKGAAKNQHPQSRYVQDASYIRLKNLQVSYTVPRRITSKFGVSDLKVYLSGENLWTGTRIGRAFDPETIDGRTDGAVVYPLFRVVSAGLSITF